MVYLSIWAISLVGFWLCLNDIDSYTYIILIYLINSLAITAVSFLSASLVNKIEVLLYSTVFGIFYMLIGFLTFDLLNMLTYGQFLFPLVEMYVVGFVFALAGFLFGKIFAFLKTR